MPEVLEISSIGNVQVGWTQLTFSALNLQNKEKSFPLMVFLQIPDGPDQAWSHGGALRPGMGGRRLEGGRRVEQARTGARQALALLLSHCSPDTAIELLPRFLLRVYHPSGKLGMFCKKISKVCQTHALQINRNRTFQKAEPVT